MSIHFFKYKYTGMLLHDKITNLVSKKMFDEDLALSDFLAQFTWFIMN